MLCMQAQAKPGHLNVSITKSMTDKYMYTGEGLRIAISWTELP